MTLHKGFAVAVSFVVSRQRVRAGASAGRTVCLVAVVCLAVTHSASARARMEPFENVYQTYIDRYQPLLVAANRAWWEASTTGSDAAFEEKKKCDLALVELHSDRELFQRVKSLRDAGTVTDPAQRRMLDILYRNFLPGQADPELQKQIVEIQTAVEQTFNTHRGRIADKEVSENDIREILGSTTDSRQAEVAWKAYMDVGTKASPGLKQLVALRNRVARELGFRDFFAMKLSLQEIDETEFLKLFDELDQLTAAPFAEVKKQIDAARAAKFKIAPADLRPWHFGDLFFQEAPEMEGADLDALYKDVDIVALTRHYYQSFGFECEDIFARSDLLEKKGKSPHAFSTDIDREGDIRVLCNIQPNAYWADTTLHEIGHAVYDKYISGDMPFLLREASHSITTEGVAMMFGAMAKNADFLTRVRKLDPKEAKAAGEAAARTLRTEKLMFARWTQVMVRFEQGLYGHPDQDLGKLWWDLKAKYQLLPPPETTNRPDYAAKVHILTEPVYYHSYLMGDLFAAQVRNTIAKKVLAPSVGGTSQPGQSGPAQPAQAQSCFFGEPKAGDFLKKEVFGPGNLYSWNDLTKRATGEPLTARYFAEQFVALAK